MVRQSYTDALAYLDGFTNFERATPNRTGRKSITLERVFVLASRLGNPHLGFKSLHVAGTKGKGSTCAFAQSILSAAGYKTGLYISPHLQDVRERISIGGVPIPEEKFAALLTLATPVLEELRELPQGERRPTYFEILTHLAFAWFTEEKVDVALIEVGLGGRLDATNIIQPVACAICNISMDHVQILGDTLAQIAQEKAGIFKAGIPVVIAPQAPEAAAVLKEQAARVGAPLESVGRELIASLCVAPDIDRAEEWPLPLAALRLSDGTEFSARLGLRGNHQVENWALAVRLADRFHLSRTGEHIPQSVVEAGSRDVRWPGRLEEVTHLADGTGSKNSRMNARPRIFLDGAHNDHSLRIILDELRVHLPERTPLVVLFACAKDKDSDAMLRTMARAGELHVIFTHSGNVRGKNPEELAREWLKLSGQAPAAISTCAAGFEMARRAAGENGLVLVTGSLYLVGAIKDALSPSFY